MDYVGHSLKNDIVVRKLYTVHYFEYPNSFEFKGEKHDFWEFVYVDKGQVIATREDEKIPLKQGDIIFHKPNEWHKISTGANEASNVVIVSFECNSPAMKFFENKICCVGYMQKSIISKIISEYKNAFSTPLNDIYTSNLEKNENPTIGSEQLLGLHICELLIGFLRENILDTPQTLISANQQDEDIKMIIEYMAKSIDKTITLNDLVKYSGINRTSVINMFKKKFKTGAIEYFINMKIDKAKELLREGNCNVTQIAQLLGYSNIHYFSRQFKNYTGMSPIEYSNSIKAMNKHI